VVGGVGLTFPQGLAVAITAAIGYLGSMKTNGSISHDRKEETPEAKARWFQCLEMSDRMELLCAFTDLALAVTPSLQERKHAQSIAGRIQILPTA
jgi:hypothetical protein